MIDQVKLVKKLIEKKCKIYGSASCGWSKKQINIFTNEKAKKLFLEKVYKNIQDMKEKPKVNGYPTLVCGDKNTHSGFKTLKQLEEFVKTDKFSKSLRNVKNETCEEKLEKLEKELKERQFDLWIYADKVKVIPGKNKINDKIIFCNIKSTTKYQVYNEFNKELNKDRKIEKLSPCEFNKQLCNALGPDWIPTCYMEYNRCGDEKHRSFAFDLYKSKYCKGNIIFDVRLSHLDGNPEFLTKLTKPESGKYVACNIDRLRHCKKCGDRCCKRDEKCCGDRCCKRDEKCCGDRCCNRDQKCCGGKCCNRGWCCGENCCTYSQRCCGDKCCSKKEKCCDGKCIKKENNPPKKKNCNTIKTCPKSPKYHRFAKCCKDNRCQVTKYFTNKFGHPLYYYCSQVPRRSKTKNGNYTDNTSSKKICERFKAMKATKNPNGIIYPCRWVEEGGYCINDSCVSCQTVPNKK